MALRIHMYYVLYMKVVNNQKQSSNSNAARRAGCMHGNGNRQPADRHHAQIGNSGTGDIYST